MQALSTAVGGQLCCGVAPVRWHLYSDTWVTPQRKPPPCLGYCSQKMIYILVIAQRIHVGVIAQRNGSMWQQGGSQKHRRGRERLAGEAAPCLLLEGTTQ